MDYEKLEEIAEYIEELTECKRNKASLAPAKAEAAVMQEITPEERAAYEKVKKLVADKRKVFLADKKQEEAVMDGYITKVTALCDEAYQLDKSRYINENINLRGFVKLNYQRKIIPSIKNKESLIQFILDIDELDLLDVNEEKVIAFAKRFEAENGILPEGMELTSKSEVSI